LHYASENSGVCSPAELRQADHKAVIAWERFMRATFITTALEVDL
jgi:hypothetical protein